MRDCRIDVQGVKLQIREYKGTGMPVVFLHHGGGNLMMWHGVVPYFRDTRHLVLLDLRGHGQSDKPATGYHIDEMAADVVGVMDHLQIERTQIVGSSLGAEVGLSLAANYPDRVASLVCEGALYSEFGPYGIREVPEAEFRREVARKLSRVRETPETVYATPEALIEANRQALEEIGWWNEHSEALVAYDVCQTEAGAYTDCWRKWAREGYFEHYYWYRFEEYYQRVRCPVLMMPSENEMEDERIARAMSKMSQLVGRCEIAHVPGAVHAYGWLLNPQGMSEAVLAFLAETRD
jgi:pimeloyl-ACP methyl ester carboxylesterase